MTKDDETVIALVEYLIFQEGHEEATNIIQRMSRDTRLRISRLMPHFYAFSETPPLTITTDAKTETRAVA